MKKNEKYDKVIANFDLDFIKNKFDNDNVAAPESLNGENVKNAIDDKEQKIIPFVKTKAFKTAVSLVACVAIVAVSLNFALGRNTQSPPVSDTEIQSGNVQFKAFSIGLFPVRSPLLGESLLFSFPAGTKLFHFPALASIIDGFYLFKVTGCPIR